MTSPPGWATIGHLMEGDLQQIRERLRELGYLRNPAERFVVGGNGGDAPGPRRLWSVSLRAWLVIGGLWAAWLTLALVESHGVYLASFLEGSLFAVYCFVPILIVSALPQALFTLAAQLLARRPLSDRGARALRTWLSWLSAALFGGSAAAFWITGRLLPGGEAPAPLWLSGVFLAGCVVLGLTANRLTSLVVGYYLGGGWTARRRLRTLLIAGGLVSAAVLALLLLDLNDERPTEPPRLEPGPPVVCLALDYLDPAEVGPGTPELLAQRERSRVYALTFPPAASPAQSWATLASGRLPEDHGISELSSLRLAGIRSPLQPRGTALGAGAYLTAVWRLLGLAEPLPVTSRDWREPPLWELICSAGEEYGAAVFNWWATYPALGRRGLHMFTDVAQAAVSRGEELPPNALFPPSGEDVEQRPLRLLLQLLNGRERARRMGAAIPPVESLERGFAEAGAAWQRMLTASGTSTAPVVVVILKPESGVQGEIWVQAAGLETGRNGELRLVDAAALLFRLCGLPLSRELPGTPPELGLTESRYVEDYGPRRLPAPTPGSLDAAWESLRSLGYIQ